MKNYEDFYSSANETWQQALDRYKLFLEAEMTEYFSKEYPYRFVNNSAYYFHKTGKVPINSLAHFTEWSGVNIPTNLSDLLSTHGTFGIGDGLFEVFNNTEKAFHILPEILEQYGYTDLLSKIGQGMLKSLSGFYFFFAVSFPQTDEVSFLYFSKAANFGKIHLSRNNERQALRKTFPSMFNGSIEKFTLDSLISNQVDRIITNALMVRGYID